MKKGQTKHWRSGPPSQSPGEDILREIYVGEKQSYADIARRFGVTKTTVKRWLRAAGIPARSISEATSLGQTGRPLTEKHLAALRKNAANARALITEESHRKQAEAMKGREPPNKGGTWTPEIHASHAYRQTLEYREAMAARQRGENAPNWKGGVSKQDIRLRSWQWRELRKQVYERDQWRCQECGVHCENKTQSKNKATVRIQCHHIVSRRNGGLDDLDNLTTLCMSCHMKREWEENRRS